MAPDPRVRVTAAGPYVVKGGVPLRDANGAPIETGRTYALCRCGASTTKPLCSDAHLAIGFAGEETADRGPIADRRETYRGQGITVYDDRSICAHVGHCTDHLSTVFKLKQEPWIDPQGADAEAIAAVVATCPSGALSYALQDSPEPVEEERPSAVTVSKDGPYWVTGGISLEAGDGTTYEVRARFALCRCGGSKNKPFCDGTHWHIGFKDG